MSVPSLEELYASVGYGGIAISRVVNKVKDEVKRRKLKSEKAAHILQMAAKKKATSNTGVIVEGIENCAVKFSKCCCPVPGDPIVGFVTRGFGVSVHRTDCPNVLASMKKPEEYGRWIKTEWDASQRHTFNSALKIVAGSRQGIVADVIMAFSNMKLNITELSTRDNDEGNTVFYLATEVNNLEQLTLVMNRVHRIKGVKDVTRNLVSGEKLNRE